MTSIHEIVKRLKEEGRRKFGIILNPPVSHRELIDFRDAFGVDLPSDIENFYRQCNGFESDDYMFRVIPLREVLEGKQEFASNQFNFAEYLIYSDTWDIKLNHHSNTYQIINDNHKSELPIELCDSLPSFLDKYLSGTGVFGEQGLYKWADEIKCNR